MTTVQLVIGAAVCLGITFAAAAIGAQFMPDDWYRNLAKPSWTPLATNTLTADSMYFSDPDWTKYAARFYRLRWP